MEEKMIKNERVIYFGSFVEFAKQFIEHGDEAGRREGCGQRSKVDDIGVKDTDIRMHLDV